MGIVELKTYQVSCDRCNRTHQIVQSQYAPGLPEGWRLRPVYDCGMTGYTRSDIICSYCVMLLRQEGTKFEGDV